MVDLILSVLLKDFWVDNHVFDVGASTVSYLDIILFDDLFPIMSNSPSYFFSIILRSGLLGL